MSGAIPPVPSTPSWHGAQLKKVQRQLYLLPLLVYSTLPTFLNDFTRFHLTFMHIVPLEATPLSL
jgi:hypothetical protein